VPASESGYGVIMNKKKKDTDLEKWHAEYRKKHKDTIEFAKKWRREKELGLHDPPNFFLRIVMFIGWLFYLHDYGRSNSLQMRNDLWHVYRIIIFAIIIGAIFLIKNFF
jgi:hypothetical protein